MEKYAIIVAGGSGVRMGSSTPKQFLLLNNKSLLWYSINTFIKAFSDIHIILVLPENHLQEGEKIIQDFNFLKNKIQIVTGGITRFHSVQNGLKLVNDEDSIIFVHDAARPLLSKNLIDRCYNTVLEFGSAIPVINCKDSVRLITKDGNEAIDRNEVKLVQTPQVFHGKIILPAFLNIDFKDKFTDEASVVEAFGLKVSLVEGEEINVKITKPADLIIAELLLV